MACIRENILCLFYTFFLFYPFVLFSLHCKYVLTTSTGHHWPLRWHNSPWLHKDFIIRPEEEPDATAEPESIKGANCDEADGDLVDQYSQPTGTCQKSDCTFNPSAHCIHQMKKRRTEFQDDIGIHVHTLLGLIKNNNLTNSLR